ncbi:GGDEF domain-containing protein [Rhizobium sp. J15]|uniref:GGDEF domain-containing protein n=1 Tax=Rhizobium sp. J15 TaxID=2035450 RepID=UPI00159672B4|nr:GGDEF domain-containing protein [Rhizobium sp. J15]
MKKSLLHSTVLTHVYPTESLPADIGAKPCRSAAALRKWRASSARMQPDRKGPTDEGFAAVFNIATGLAIWCSEAMTLALVLFVAWRHNVKNEAYLYWGFGFLLTGIGFAMVAWRGQIPSVLSIEAGNAIALLGQSAWVAGFLALDRKKIEWWALLPPVIWLAGIFLPWVNDDYSNRVVLYNLASATGATALAMAVAAGDMRRERTRVKLMGVFVIQGCLCFGSALTMALTLPSEIDATNLGGASAMASAFLLTIAFALTCRLIMERSERHLRALSLTDALTGVLNRRGLLGYFDTIQERAHDEQRQVAVLLFDLDHFKRVNDRFGHQSGDAVLTAFARMARQYIPNNIFGRMGGEEFAAFAAVADQTEAEAIAEAIRTEFCRLPVSTGEAIVPVTVSIGIALASSIEANIDKLISASDRALYAAKAAGRNCTVTFGEAEAAAPAPAMPSSTAGELVPTVDDQVEALRRMSTLSRAG